MTSQLLVNSPNSSPQEMIQNKNMLIKNRAGQSESQREGVDGWEEIN